MVCTLQIGNQRIYLMHMLNPECMLTTFYTELTGIMQETIDDQSYFTEIFSNFCE